MDAIIKEETIILINSKSIWTTSCVLLVLHIDSTHRRAHFPYTEQGFRGGSQLITMNVFHTDKIIIN